MRYAPHHRFKGSAPSESSSKPKRSSFAIASKVGKIKWLALLAIILFNVLTVAFGGHFIGKVAAAPDPGGGGDTSVCSGYTRVNAFTICRGGQFYYSYPEVVVNFADQPGEVDVNGSVLNVKSGPVFQAINLAADFCYDAIYYQFGGARGAGGGWVEVFSDKDTKGNCAPQSTIKLAAPANNGAGSKIMFFDNAAADKENVKLSNGTPFVKVNGTFTAPNGRTSADVRAVYMEQKPASQCPDMLIYYKVGNPDTPGKYKIGYFSPTISTLTVPDSSYRAALRAATGEDNDLCAMPSGVDHAQDRLEKTFMVGKSGWLGGQDDVSFLGGPTDVKLLNPAIFSISNAAGGAAAVDRTGAIENLQASAGDQNGDGTTPSCETTGFGLAWILCSIIDGLADAVDGIYTHLIEPMLVTPTLDPDTPNGRHLKQAWSNFRVLADVFLVLAVLAIVFGESLGGGLIDAYSVKKTLPRLLAAAILINISFYLVVIAVDVSNVVGKGIASLITTPFGIGSGAGSYHFDLNQGAGAQATSIIAVGGATGAAAIATYFTAGAALSAGLGATLAFLFFVILLPFLFLMIAIAATLILRIALIFLLVIVSPVAFALYTLPNTEQYFRRWWHLFQETLLVYPIITAIFALSAVVSQAMLWSTGN